MLLSVNAGSSSLKLAVFDDAATRRLFEAAVSEIGGAARLEVGGKTEAVAAGDHAAAFAVLRDALDAAGLALADMRGAGHRVVHGGNAFTAATRIDDDTLAALERLNPLVPLHNPPALAAIRALQTLAPDMAQVACFDTAFHATQPDVARHYALPASLREKGYRRYGFHGLSYQGLVERIPEQTGELLPDRVVALHLGNGASVCAIRHGRSVATSMGFSPLEGLTMGTRSGSLDAALVLRLARELGIDETEHLLTRESGLKGLSGGLSDMRELEAAGTPEAGFAIEHFCHWAARHAGSMIAAMQGVDLIAFTGGIGEHASAVRERIEVLLAWTGAPSMVVPADEERVIAAAIAGLLA